MGQEENVRQVIIPLDEYNNMTSELANMKSLKEQEIKETENKIREYYEGIIGKGLDIGYFQYHYGTLSQAISTLDRYASSVKTERNRFNSKILEQTNRIDNLNNIIETLRKDLDEKKQHELHWREMYYMLADEKKLHWWQIFERIRLKIKRKRKLNKSK